MAETRSHLGTIQHLEGPDGVAGRRECLATGSSSVHMGRCPQCGQVGCCDSSPNRHASAHHRATGHPVIRSLEPGDEWLYPYEDDVAFVVGR